MSSSRPQSILLLTYTAALLILIPLSWIGEIYGWGTQSLLGSYGMSWLITELMPTAKTAPWPEIALLLVTLSLLIKSGLATALRPHARRNLRERRALQAVAVAIALTLLLLIILFTTNSPLLFSPLGSLKGSPIHHAFLTLLMLWIALLAIIHGIALGRMLTLADILCAATRLPQQTAPLIISLPLTAILCAALNYAFPPLAFQPLIPHILYTLTVITALLACKTLS